VVRAIGAVLTAFSPIFPLALSINWARVATTRYSLALIDFTALLPTKLGLHRDNPMTCLGAFWIILIWRILTLLCASFPLTPLAFAINGTLLQFARVVMLCTILVWALLPTVCGWNSDPVELCCDAFATFS